MSMPQERATQLSLPYFGPLLIEMGVAFSRETFIQTMAAGLADSSYVQKRQRLWQVTLFTLYREGNWAREYGGIRGAVDEFDVFSPPDQATILMATIQSQAWPRQNLNQDSRLNVEGLWAETPVLPVIRRSLKVIDGLRLLSARRGMAGLPVKPNVEPAPGEEEIVFHGFDHRLKTASQEAVVDFCQGCGLEVKSEVNNQEAVVHFGNSKDGPKKTWHFVIDTNPLEAGMDLSNALYQLMDWVGLVGYPTTRWFDAVFPVGMEGEDETDLVQKEVVQSLRLLEIPQRQLTLKGNRAEAEGVVLEVSRRQRFWLSSQKS